MCATLPADLTADHLVRYHRTSGWTRCEAWEWAAMHCRPGWTPVGVYTCPELYWARGPCPHLKADVVAVFEVTYGRWPSQHTAS